MNYRSLLAFPEGGGGGSVWCSEEMAGEKAVLPPHPFAQGL